jgi:hypothetical protein
MLSKGCANRETPKKYTEKTEPLFGTRFGNSCGELARGGDDSCAPDRFTCDGHQLPCLEQHWRQ